MPGAGTRAGSTVDQFGSPAVPLSLPHQRTSGPASEKITAFGCSFADEAQLRGQS